MTPVSSGFFSIHEREHMPYRLMLVSYPVSVVVNSVISSCFVYELEKSTKLAFSRNTLPVCPL